MIYRPVGCLLCRWDRQGNLFEWRLSYFLPPFRRPPTLLR